MFLSHRLTHNRISALIALLAIGLLFIAPDISKILEQQRMSAYMPADTSAVMAGMDESGEMDEMAEMNAQRAGHHASHTHPSAAHPAAQPAGGATEAPLHAPGMGMDTMDGFSCGYCELLVHLPMLVWIFVPLLWLILLSSRLPPQPPLPLIPLSWFPGTCQPRAPPAR